MTTPNTENIAYLSWSVDVECPSCKEESDLSGQDDDHVISRAIFSNKWEALSGFDVTCPKCEHEFQISKVEY